MPTYEYRCVNGHTFEVFQRMSDEPVTSCPDCGGEAERLLSAGAGLLFKGSGFYITDSRPESYKKKAADEGGGSSSAPDSGKSTVSGAGNGDKGGKAESKSD